MRARRAAALLLTLLLLGGCRSGSEINQLAFVMGIAVDGAGGPEDYRVTVQAARPYLLMSSGGADGGPDSAGDSYVNFSEAGRGIGLPLDALARAMSRRLYTGHNQVLILGRVAAEQGIAPILDHFIRVADGRLTVSLFVADRAAAVLEAETELGHIPAAHLVGLLSARRGGADVRPATLMTFLSAMLSPTTAPTAPLVTLEGGRIALEGTAVFKGDRLVGTLDADQTRALSLVTGAAQRDVVAVDIAGGSVALNISPIESRVRPVLENGALGIEVTITGQCIVADAGGVEGLLSPAPRRQLAEAAEAQLLALLAGTLAVSRELEADIFGFGEALYRRFPKESAPLLEDWATAYTELPVQFSAELEISSTGALLEALVARP